MIPFKLHSICLIVHHHHFIPYLHQLQQRIRIRIRKNQVHDLHIDNKSYVMNEIFSSHILVLSIDDLKANPTNFVIVDISQTKNNQNNNQDLEQEQEQEQDNEKKNNENQELGEHVIIINVPVKYHNILDGTNQQQQQQQQQPSAEREAVITRFLKQGLEQHKIIENDYILAVKGDTKEHALFGALIFIKEFDKVCLFSE